MTTPDERLGRILLLIPYVLSKPQVSVKEVCDRFGITRTQLSRDLQLLFVCGRPGYGPGDLIEAEIIGSTVSIRTAEYFNRPPRLTPAEGLLLYAGARAALAAGARTDSLDRAISRLEEVLGAEALERVSVGVEDAGDLSIVRQALDTRKRLHIVYQSQSKDEVTSRDVDPWTLLLSAGRWYLGGWCYLASDARVFRVDRMRSVELLQEQADVPEDFDLSKFETSYVRGSGSTDVVIDVLKGSAWRITDYYPVESAEEAGSDHLRITLSVGGFAWLIRLLLTLGKKARVVSPAKLQEELEAKAQELLNAYSDETSH